MAILINDRLLIILIICLCYTIINVLVIIYKKIENKLHNIKETKIKEKESLNKKLKKLEYDNIQFKNDILRLDLELKDLKKVSIKK